MVACSDNLKCSCCADDVYKDDMRLQKITHRTPVLNSNWVTYYSVTFPTSLHSIRVNHLYSLDSGYFTFPVQWTCTAQTSIEVGWSERSFLPRQNNLWTLNPQLCCTLKQPSSKRLIYHTSAVIIAYMSKVTRAVLAVGTNF